jgi:hypothetical protein
VVKKRRRRTRTREASGMAVGVGWYSREKWEQLRVVAADPEQLGPSYEEWLEMAEGSLADLAGSGLRPEKVELDIDKLVAWCKAQNRPIDAAARADFTSRYLRMKHESPHKLGGA